MNEIIKVNYENPNRPTVSGRELHKGLEVKTPYTMWFERMEKYGFTENSDFVTVHKSVIRSDGTEMPQETFDHQLTLDMAKELCMIQRSDKGKEFRQYFIECEKAWNSPEAIMARALQLANNQLDLLKSEKHLLEIQICNQKPLVQFAETVSSAENCIDISEMAKLLSKKGYLIGRNKLFAILRNANYLMKNNQPYQKYINDGLFKAIETTFYKGNVANVAVKTLITGKGQHKIYNLVTELYTS